MQNNPNALNEYDWSQNNEQLTPRLEPKKLDTSQKIAVAVLAVFAIAVFTVWIIQFKQGLSGATAKKSVNVNTGVQTIDPRQKDTDKDGLNDYDELNVYGTSPYLEDSDSDGYDDNEELKNSNDPNCPVGQVCNAAAVTEAMGEEEINNISDKLQLGTAPVEGTTVENQNTSVNNQAQLESAQSILDGQGDAASLRKMLISSGMDSKVLDQISDEELMKTYRDILSN